MLWKKKGANKKQLGVPSGNRRENSYGRRVWGFPCSPDIPARMKMLAERLHVPVYALAEHALQLAAGLMARMADNPMEYEILRQHLQESHVDLRTIEKISRLDEEMAEILDKERRQRLQIEQAVRQIVVKYARAGLSPQEIDEVIDYGLRCRIAVAKGQPVPRCESPDADDD